jgi:hypothetical protein
MNFSFVSCCCVGVFESIITAKSYSKRHILYEFVCGKTLTWLGFCIWIAEACKAWICGGLLAGIVGSNSTEGMHVCVLLRLCVL